MFTSLLFVCVRFELAEIVNCFKIGMSLCSPCCLQCKKAFTFSLCYYENTQTTPVLFFAILRKRFSGLLKYFRQFLKSRIFFKTSSAFLCHRSNSLFKVRIFTCRKARGNI